MVFINKMMDIKSFLSNVMFVVLCFSIEFMTIVQLVNKIRPIVINSILCLLLIGSVGFLDGDCEGGLHRCILPDGTSTCDCPPI